MCSNALRRQHLLRSITLWGLCVSGILALWATGTQTAFAQEAKPDPNIARPADDAAWEKLIYLPYKNLKEVFDKHGSTVFIPYSEYLKKWQTPDNANDKKAVEAVITEAHYSARVDKSLLRIKAQLTVKVLGKPWVEVPVKFGSAAVGKLTSQKDGDVLLMGTGNGTYKLLFGSAGEHKLELELAAPIQTSPDGRKVDFEVPPVAVTTFELAIPEADQTVELTPQMVALPVETAEKETRVKANLGSTTKIGANWHSRTSQKPEMELLAAVTNLQKVTFRDGLVHTDAYLTYEILRGELSEAQLVVPVGQRVLGVTSNDAKIRSWKAEPGEKKQTVKVEFLNPVKGKLTLEVHTEREFKGEPIDVLGKAESGAILGVHSSDAVRESGQIVVAKGDDLELSFETMTGLSRIDAAEVAERLRQDGTTAFKFYSSNIRLTVLAKPVEPRLIVENSNYSFEIHEDEIRLHASLGYAITRAGVFEVKFKLPDNLIIDSVEASGGGAVREFHVEGENPRTLRVTLVRRTVAEASLGINLRAHLKFAEANEMVELTMPIPEPLGIERETATVYVMASESVEVITDPTSVQGAQPLPINIGIGFGGQQGGGQQGGGQAGMAGLRVASAWQFNRRPVSIPVKTVRKPTRLTAQIATSINVKEETTEVVTELRYLVQYAGLDTFRFEVPESVTGDVQIVSLESAPLPPIKQKVKADKAENGWVTWTITLQREVTGTYRFKVSYDLKPKVLGADDDAAKKDDEKPVAKKPADPNRPSLSVVQVARALGLDGSDAKKREVELSSVFGEVVVDKSRALAIETTKLDDGLEAIDVRELSLMPQSGAQAYRYYRQPAAVKVEARKYAIQEVVETVVMRSLVEVVTRKDVTASYRCRYWLKSSERQRLRIDLPVGSELLGVFVDGKQVSPEQNNEKRGDDEKAAWDSYFINVARTKPSDEPFSLTLQTSTPVGEAKRAPYESAQSSMTLRLPQVGGLGAGGIATQQMQVVVWAPSKFDLVGEPGKFVAESKLRLEDALFSRRYQPTDFFNVDQWVNVPGAGIIDFPTEGNRYRYSNLGGTDSIEITWVNRGYYTWLFSGALVVLGLLLRKVGWEQKLLLLLIGGFVAALVGLFYPGWIAEFFGMARYGLAVMLGTWVLQALFESRTTVSNVPASDPATPWSVDAVPAVVPPPGVFDDMRRAFEK